MRAKLSVLLPTFNNEGIIRATLESISWADEILAVDSFSTDNTLDICREYGARILQHEYEQSAKQKNWAIPQCAHDWVFQIDSDEVLEPGLREEIEAVLENITYWIGGFAFAVYIPNITCACFVAMRAALKIRKFMPMSRCREKLAPCNATFCTSV